MEGLSIVTANEMSLAAAKRLHYPGTNQGNKIGDVVLPDTASLWTLSCEEKLPIMGRFRVAVGGQTPGVGEDGPGRGAKRKAPDTREPVCCT